MAAWVGLGKTLYVMHVSIRKLWKMTVSNLAESMLAEFRSRHISGYRRVAKVAARWLQWGGLELLDRRDCLVHSTYQR